jgi:hypothetical protein
LYADKEQWAMKRFTRAAAVLLLGIGAAVSNAMDASKLVDEATYAELKEKGQIQKSYYKQNNVTLTLAPDTELTKGAVSFWKNDYEPVFLVENLYLIPKKDLGDGTTGKNLIDKSSKIIRSVSRSARSIVLTAKAITSRKRFIVAIVSYHRVGLRVGKNSIHKLHSGSTISYNIRSVTLIPTASPFGT